MLNKTLCLRPLLVRIDEIRACEEVPTWVSFALAFRIFTLHSSWTFLFPALVFNPANDPQIKNIINFIFFWFSEKDSDRYGQKIKLNHHNIRRFLFLVQSERYFQTFRLMKYDELLRMNCYDQKVHNIHLTSWPW